MNDKDIENLIKNYTQNFYSSEKEQNNGVASRAWELDDIVSKNPEAGLKILIRLINSTEDNEFLAFIAAGPLENMIRNNFQQIIEKLEDEAKKSSKFRKCLTGVWFGSDLNDEQVAIIRKYTNAVKDPL